MAEGDIVFYNVFKKDLNDMIHDLGADLITITLHTAYTPDIDTDEVWADVSGTEYSTADGYTAGGIVLAGHSVTVDTTNDWAEIDYTSPVWSSLGALTPATPSHAIVWNNTPAAPEDPLICYIELGETATNGGDYTIDFHADGLFTTV
ncbi:MAG: hypothetical protein JRE40_00130 [Deltaproteobacteria bacterium]|nr:hypothetical protein [Deltaproteobacteria bacterium]